MLLIFNFPTGKESEMDEDSAMIKQIKETEGMIVRTLSRCENMIDDELMELITKNPTEGMPMRVVSRVVEKLLSLLHQEPAALVGVEEEVEWIETEMIGTTGYGKSHEFTVELVEFAYDFEGAIDNLLLKSAAQESRKDNNPKIKKNARRIQDKLRFMDDFLKEFESGGLCSRGMVWMVEEILTISSSAVDVMEEMISRRDQGFIHMDSLKSQQEDAMEMEQICSRFLDQKKEAGWLGQTAFPNQANPWSVDLPDQDEEENMEINKMSITGDRS